MKVHRYNYETLEAFISEAAKPVHSTYANSGGSVWEEDQRADPWAGTKTRAEAFTIAREGWPQGRENMLSAMAQAATQLSKGPDFYLDVGGAYPVAAIAAAGSMECMVNSLPISDRMRPIVRIAFNIWVSSAYRPREITNYGAAVLSYVDALEQNGNRVEITGMVHCACNRTPDKYSLNVLVKRAEDPMELDRLTFCLTHPAMLRRLAFGHMQNRDELAASSMLMNCGTPENPDPKRDLEQGQLFIPGINTFNPGATELSSPANAAKALEPILAKMLAESGIAPPELAFKMGGGQ